jgi:hypothetical protein
MRIIEAFKAFFAALRGEKNAAAPETPEKTAQAPAPPHPPPPPPPPQPDPAREKEIAAREFENGAVYTLALFQREGRLVDFLQEDLGDCDDEQVAAAARQIHESCRKVLNTRFTVERIMSSEEGKPCAVPDGFNPSEIIMTGNPPPAPPYKGTLQHKGWRAVKTNFPERTGKVDPKVVYPAEINF